jgi:hypothetical protein
MYVLYLLGLAYISCRHYHPGSWIDWEGCPYEFCSEGERTTLTMMNRGWTMDPRRHAYPRKCTTCYRAHPAIGWVNTEMQSNCLNAETRNDVCSSCGDTPWTIFLVRLEKSHKRVFFDCTQHSTYIGVNYTSNIYGTLRTWQAIMGHKTARWSGHAS